MTNNWGLSLPTFSNGAAYADFDNDGAMDMVINNIDDEALLYRNTSCDKDKGNSHFLNVRFNGGPQNVNGIGATANIFYDHGKQQLYENNPYRGYLSTVDCMAHFGLGKMEQIDSVVVRWNTGKKQVLKNVKADRTIVVDIRDAIGNDAAPRSLIAQHTLFRDITAETGITYRHSDIPFLDFTIQALLPHKLSEYNPALAAGDVNGDGLDDLVIGGNAAEPPKVLLQQPDGKFIQKDLTAGTGRAKDEGILLFDANGDGKPDIYVACGGYGAAYDTLNYQDRLYINDGKGNFREDTAALPFNHTSKLCVRAFDYNGDGKLDLFVSGRVVPGQYPKPVSSFIFRNDSKNGHVKFTDVTAEVAPDLKDIGMVCDALFTDFDGDGLTDLILVGEWMPVTLLKNIGGKFRNVTNSSGVAGQSGWWNCIAAGDFRHTGRTDYIVGNVGLNTFYQGDKEFPVSVTAKDFENNGAYIAITSLYLPDQQGQKKDFPAFGRDDIARQFPGIKKRFATYKPFALATMDDLLTPEQRSGALRMKANTFQTCFLRNDGGGKFALIPLPREAQVSVINGMVVDDFDGDGNLDVLMNGNDYGTEVATGRYDALNGLLLKGDGKGNFSPKSILESGIWIPGNGKALVKLMGSSGDYRIAASQHQEAMKLFQLKRRVKAVRVEPDDVSAVLTDKTGTIRKEEFYYGSSFLSQSSRFILVDSNIQSVAIRNSKGKLRLVK